MTQHHDIIIVGAGSAGCALAARLSEDPTCRVLLLEAGGQDRGLHVRIPAAFPKLFKSALDWDLATAPEPAMQDRRLYWPRGRMIGGSSSMNAQCYVRGNAADFDLWEDLGNPGWAFRDVLPYFMRAEGYTRPTAGHHGGDGPLRVEELRDAHPATEAFLRGAEEVGIPRVDDVNGPSQDGAARMRVTQRAGRRWSAADAYLRPALGRRNLTVVTNASVTRLLLDGRRATGVEWRSGTTLERASAGEIIVSAGAIGSPHLLMLSGIGPAAELARHGLPVLADLSGVGRNLQDHLAVPIVRTCREPSSLLSAESVPNLLRFLLLGRGPLTSNVGEACAFVRTRPELEAPDVELLFAPVPFVEHGLVPQTEHALTVGVVLLQPRSRGELRLDPRDPTQAPEIHARYLSDAGGEDLATLLRGIELARRVFAAPAMSTLVSHERLPGSTPPEEHLRRYGQTLYHPIGTCRMGPDRDAVVDHALRVHGIERLRVADASIMPVIVRGHTHGPTVMIAERAADLVLGREIAPARARTEARGGATGSSPRHATLRSAP